MSMRTEEVYFYFISSFLRQLFKLRKLFIYFESMKEMLSIQKLCFLMKLYFKYGSLKIT